MESLSTITTWEPPHRFVAESRDDMGPDDPTVATEWIVETRSGGTCVVRVVHSWFTSSDDWDNQFEGRIRLALVLPRPAALSQHFRGQPCSPFQLMGVAPEPKPEAWSALTVRSGWSGPPSASGWTPLPGAPPLGGLVENVGQRERPGSCSSDSTSRRLASPTSSPSPWAARYLPVRLYLYGDQAPAAAARDEPIWHAWMSEHFPIAVGTEAVTTG